jgi:hypothetical protein
MGVAHGERLKNEEQPQAGKGEVGALRLYHPTGTSAFVKHNLSVFHIRFDHISVDEFSFEHIEAQ